MGDNLDAVLFTVHGFLGSLLYILVHMITNTREAIRRIAIGSIAGYIYFQLYSTYGFPDGLMAIVFGYFSVDIIENVFEKLREKITRIFLLA